MPFLFHDYSRSSPNSLLKDCGPVLGISMLSTESEIEISDIITTKIEHQPTQSYFYNALSKPFSVSR